jgi:glycosyltransferase involved in cell wall biosynthesis
VRIALLHYHLRRGGVTSVIYNQARALREAGHEVLLIAGEDQKDAPEFPFKMIAGLAYDQFNRDPLPVEQRAPLLADAIAAAMDAHWGGSADVLHVHNPLIRKNAALSPALRILTERGYKLLLQAHDLAEDFRPDVYVESSDYPENCHYAVINSRDYSFLHRAGLKVEGLHLVPNEVMQIEAAPGLERNRYLYPVRAIRRKNIGEALLFSLFVPQGHTVAITLPPVSEKDFVMYRHWMQVAKDLNLPVEFGVGLHAGRAEVFGSAICVITTSIKEGFGFSYLEPWTAGLEVMGRCIDYVCRDFEDSGVRFNSLYNSFDIPMVFIPAGQLRKKIEDAAKSAFQSFHQKPPPYIFKRISDELFSSDMIDFGRLDETLQEEILRALSLNQAVTREVAAINPVVLDLASWKADEDLIAANAAVIARAYGREKISRILEDTYRAVMDNPVCQKLSKAMLLELYLDPSHFCLVGLGLPEVLLSENA